MKTIITFLLFTTAFSFSNNAQTFTWVTNDTIETNLALNTTVLLKMEQAAIGTDSVTLGIEVIYNDIPSSWDGMVCIQGVCLGSIPVVGTTAQMTEIYGSMYGYVRLTVDPLNGTEAAKLQIYVYDIEYPNDGDTATWLLNTTLSLEDQFAFDKQSVYPNPVQSTLNISSSKHINKVDVFTLDGVKVAEKVFNTNGDKQMDVSELPSGLYLVRMTNETNDIFTTKFLKE
ncbi:MAG: T9SS type A sorting domain-containing protein [Crocinitomicaceae bacterium]|nr:T9SS type A sorting domain-containing protein [Crocinitomicaceae bacterium]